MRTPFSELHALGLVQLPEWIAGAAALAASVSAAGTAKREVVR